VSTDVSEEHIASIFKGRKSKLSKKAVCKKLKMEAVCSSETSVGTQRTTRRDIPEDGTLPCIDCSDDSNLFLRRIIGNVSVLSCVSHATYQNLKIQVFEILNLFHTSIVLHVSRLFGHL
jgi:hypothetical protein